VVVIVYLIAVFLRLHIAGVSKEKSEWHPFTLENALLFHYAEQFAEKGTVPRIDYRAQYPEGLQVSKKLSLGKGLAAGVVWRLLPLKVEFADFVRIFDVVVFSTGAIAMYLLVVTLTGNRMGAVAAAAFYAIAFPAVLRSTGMEFSRENFALPFLFFHTYLYARSLKSSSPLSSIIAAVFMAVAVSTWDMSQLYLTLVGLYVVLRLLAAPGNLSLVKYLIPTFALCAIAGVIVPYLVDHNFMASYAMVIGYALVLVYAISSAKFLQSKRLKRAAVLILVLAAIVIVPRVSGYGSRYSHFGDLVKAKIKYVNVKPTQPEKLSYNARIMWTPALHSATSKFFGRYPISDFVPFILLMAAPLTMWLINCLRLNKKPLPEGHHLIFFMAGVFFLLYLLFVRMQVFLIFFMCAAIGLNFFYLRLFLKRRGYIVAWIIVLLPVFVTQAAYSRKRIETRMATGEDYQHLKEVVDLVKSKTEPDAVILADFMLEPVIFHYGNRKIVLHPKFESADMRTKVKEYLEALFDGKERVFYDFCMKNGVDYYLFNPNIFWGYKNEDAWIYSSRYVSGRRGLLDATEIYKLFSSSQKLNYFYPVDGTENQLFRVANAKNKKKAEEYYQTGAESWKKYLQAQNREDLNSAEEQLTSAVEYYPWLIKAHSMLVTVFNEQKNYELPGSEKAKEYELGARISMDRCKELMQEERND